MSDNMFEGINLADRPLPTKLPSNHDLGDGLMIMTWAMLAFSTVLVALRMISKIWILKRFRLDDVFLLVTWVSLTLFSDHQRWYANAPIGGCCRILSHDANVLPQRLRSTLQ